MRAVRRQQPARGLVRGQPLSHKRRKQLVCPWLFVSLPLSSLLPFLSPISHTVDISLCCVCLCVRLYVSVCAYCVRVYFLCLVSRSLAFSPLLPLAPLSLSLRGTALVPFCLLTSTQASCLAIRHSEELEKDTCCVKLMPWMV